MREIKFRIPHYDYKGNFKVFSYWGRIEDGVFASPASYSDGPVKKPDEQFTGLKDKNGKEIYEGDIVKYIEHTNYFGDKSEENVCEIKIEFTWFDTEYSGGPDGSTRFTNVEVIGNIHENPELLK